MNNETKTIGYMVRCKCSTARITVPAVVEIKKERVRTGGIIGVPGSATFETRERRVRRPLFEGFDYLLTVMQGCTRCDLCSRYFKVTQITGRTTEHECNAKCLASKGPLCECACGGANHGGKYA